MPRRDGKKPIPEGGAAMGSLALTGAHDAHARKGRVGLLSQQLTPIGTINGGRIQSGPMLPHTTTGRVHKDRRWPRTSLMRARHSLIVQKILRDKALSGLAPARPA